MHYRMIEAGQIHASIDDSAGMVTFLEDPEQYHGAEVVDKLSKQIALSNDLSARVQAANCLVSLFMLVQHTVRFIPFSQHQSHGADGLFRLECSTDGE